MYSMFLIILYFIVLFCNNYFFRIFQSMIYRSFSEYQEDLELRIPLSSTTSSSLPRKYRCSGRVGRGGRIVVDRFPVEHLCIFFINFHWFQLFNSYFYLCFLFTLLLLCFLNDWLLTPLFFLLFLLFQFFLKISPWHKKFIIEVN